MTNLDDQAVYQSHKSIPDVVASINAFGKQLTQAFSEASQTTFSQKYKHVKNVVVCGMGGSRFTPLAVRELFKERLNKPYVVNDNYTLPGYVGHDTLVILSSYSGDTEEVVACAREAVAREALITAVTTGGQLAEICQQADAAAYVFDPVHNPSGQPRIGVGYMIAGHIGIAKATGLIDIHAQEIDETMRSLDKLLSSYTINIQKGKNGAKQLAEIIDTKYPYIVTSEFLQGAGNMFANALNETAKNISSPRVIPELNHHLIEGLRFPKELADIGLFIFFFSHLYHERIQKRYRITQEIVEQNGLSTYWHELSGPTKLAQLLEAIGFASYVTLYLAILHNQDPNSIPFVDAFKQHLNEV